jgi:enoyl-CoA hydratase/carnithine racemase
MCVMPDRQQDSITTDILECKDRSFIGLIRLNRPKALNALSLDMAKILYEQLIQWHQDTSISMVILASSSAKAFCAGGDIRQLYTSMQKAQLGPNDYAAHYFNCEYQLDYLIHCYQKPLMIWGEGFVLGGGLGLFWGGNLRVATPSSRIGWPEINIGLYPDVGGTYALSHMPKTLGLWMGLTGSLLDAKEATIAGLVDFYLPSDRWDEVVAGLTAIDWASSNRQRRAQAAAVISSLGTDFDSHPCEHPSYWLGNHNRLCALFTDLEPSSVQQRLNQLVTTLSHTVSLSQASLSQASQWLLQGCQQWINGSPRTARMVLEQCQRGQALSLKQAFELEWAMSVNCAQSKDLLEGIRAQLIDRDRSPKWQEPAFELQSQAFVDVFFQAPKAIESSITDQLNLVEAILGINLDRH